jgi:hypothetical protein
LRVEIKDIRLMGDSTNSELNKKGEEIIAHCDVIKKRFIELESENGSTDLKADLANTIVMHEHTVQAGFRNEMYNELSNKLEMLSREYNALAAKTNQLPIVFETISNSKEANSMSCFVMLNQLTLVQRTVLQNQRTLLTTK